MIISNCNVNVVTTGQQKPKIFIYIFYYEIVT